MGQVNASGSPVSPMYPAAIHLTVEAAPAIVEGVWVAPVPRLHWVAWREQGAERVRCPRMAEGEQAVSLNLTIPGNGPVSQATGLRQLHHLLLPKVLTLRAALLSLHGREWHSTSEKMVLEHQRQRPAQTGNNPLPAA